MSRFLGVIDHKYATNAFNEGPIDPSVEFIQLEEDYQLVSNHNLMLAIQENRVLNLSILSRKFMVTDEISFTPF